MKAQIKKTEISVAKELGRVAFENGIPNAPALDPTVREMVKGNKVGESVHIFKAWVAGWTAANIAH